ncbi:MAG: sterol desaturase family protein [Myxococcales bacterium]|nr:sterol desaturase family protein [Myxococcales bacterium]
MSAAAVTTAAMAFGLALLVGTFVEYWGHRLMHVGRVLKKRHARHHQRGTGQGWLGEFRDYVLPTLLICWVGFLHSTEAGVGFLLGDLCYAALAAYAHQLQHERPKQVFWLSQPVHAVHHYHQEWHHNFGITVDVWDRVFGTFKAHPPITAFDELDNDKGRLDIHWASVAPPLPRRRRSAR